MTPRNTGIPSGWQGTPRRTWRPEYRRPRYPRSAEFPQYPHNQEKTMFEKLKSMFNRTAPDGPTYDPHPHSWGTDDAVMGLTDEDDRAADYEAHERFIESLNRESARFEGIGEYDDPATSPYTDPTK